MNRLLSVRKSAVRSVAVIPGSARYRRLAMFVSLKKVSISIFNSILCSRGALNCRSAASRTIHARAAWPQSSCDPRSHLKIRLTRRHRAAWRVGNRIVLLAIGGLRRAPTTAEAECFEMLRITDRPPAHAGPQLHKFDGNQRRRRTSTSFLIDYHVPSGLTTTAESAIAFGSFSRLLDFRHLKSIELVLSIWPRLRFFQGLIAHGADLNDLDDR